MITVFDLNNLYKEYFSKSPYYIAPKGDDKTSSKEVVFSSLPTNDIPKGTIHYSKKFQPFNKVGAYGKDVWHPVTFKTLYNGENIELEINACTIAVNLSKTIVKTAVSERKGTVKEIFNVDDYHFTIRGFLIGQNRRFPEEDIEKLKKIFESGNAVELHSGYAEMFLDETCNVAISTLELPEVQGKAHWIRPFSLVCDSDFIDELILD